MSMKKFRPGEISIWGNCVESESPDEITTSFASRDTDPYLSVQVYASGEIVTTTRYRVISPQLCDRYLRDTDLVVADMYDGEKP